MTVNCGQCGYDLSGHDGQLRRCPECGVLTDVENGVRPVVPGKWLWIGAVSLGLGFAGVLSFHIVLHTNGLRLMDLWNNASPMRGVAKPRAAAMANVAGIVATVVMFHAMAQAVYLAVIGGWAIWRRDVTTVSLAVLLLIGTVVYFVLGFQIGGVLAGL